jgi:N-acetylglucosaminylphosphatidylinositol deacetylase
MATRTGFYAIFALFPFFLALLLRPLHSDNVFSFQPNTIPSNPSRILLLTAHPDDETFFFGPTLTSLIPSSETSVSTSPASSNSIAHPFPQVYSLCFSVGNAYGLGEVRRREFEGSLDVIGVAKDKRWILDEPYVTIPCLLMFSCNSQKQSEFPDSITTKWDASLIAATVNRYVVDYNISTVRALLNDIYSLMIHVAG